MNWRAIFARVFTAMFLLVSCAASACDASCSVKSLTGGHCHHGAMAHSTSERASGISEMTPDCAGNMHGSRGRWADVTALSEPCHHQLCGVEVPALLKSVDLQRIHLSQSMLPVRSSTALSSLSSDRSMMAWSSPRSPDTSTNRAVLRI